MAKAETLRQPTVTCGTSGEQVSVRDTLAPFSYTRQELLEALARNQDYPEPFQRLLAKMDISGKDTVCSLE